MLWGLMKNLSNNFSFSAIASGSSNPKSGCTGSSSSSRGDGRKRITYNLLNMTDNEDGEDSDSGLTLPATTPSRVGGFGHKPSDSSSHVRQDAEAKNIDDDDDDDDRYDRGSSFFNLNYDKRRQPPQEPPKPQKVTRGLRDRLRMKNDGNPTPTPPPPTTNNNPNKLTALKFTFEDFSDDSDYEEDEDGEDEDDDEDENDDMDDVDEDGDIEDEDYENRGGVEEKRGCSSARIPAPPQLPSQNPPPPARPSLWDHHNHHHDSSSSITTTTTAGSSYFGKRLPVTNEISTMKTTVIRDIRLDKNSTEV